MINTVLSPFTAAYQIIIFSGIFLMFLSEWIYEKKDEVIPADKLYRDAKEEFGEFWKGFFK